MSLTAADAALAMTKRRAGNRLGFAVLLLHFRKHGRFPRSDDDVDPSLITAVIGQLGIDPELVPPLMLSDRTAERHRAEIRGLLGFREATVADGEALAMWLRDHAVTESRDICQVTVALYGRCRSLNIEPPATDRVERIVRAAIHAFDERFCAGIVERLPLAVQSRLDALLGPAGDSEKGGSEKAISSDQSDGYTPAVLMGLRADPGGPSVNKLADRDGQTRHHPEPWASRQFVR